MSGIPHVWSITPESRSRGGGSRRGRGVSGYTRIRPADGLWWVGWRWKNETRWHAGSVATREEAEAWRDATRESLLSGEVPDELPTVEPREDVAPAPVTLGELGERRARLAAQLRPGAERCARCGMLRPCDPCVDEVKHEMRSARRGT